MRKLVLDIETTTDLAVHAVTNKSVKTSKVLLNLDMPKREFFSKSGYLLQLSAWSWDGAAGFGTGG